jgi:putative ABC transport system permease protein
MSWIRVLGSRLLDVVLRRRREQRLDDEVRSHLDLLTDEYVARGLSLADARLAARKAFGGVDQIKARYRDRRGLPWLDAGLQDLRYAVRLIIRDRSFSAVVVIALALGMGVSTLTFTVVYSLNLRRLPFADPAKIVAIGGEGNRTQGSSIPFGVFEGWGSATKSFSAIAAYADAAATLGDDTHPTELIPGTFISHNGFALLGMRPVLGRDFRPEDDRVGAPAVMMLGYGVWASRYGSDPSIVGSTVRIDGQPATIIGVMPEGFRFPTESEVWRPLAAMPSTSTPASGQRGGRIFGRLAEGITIESARAELASIVSTLPAASAADRTRRTIVVPLNESFHGSVTDPAPLVILSAGILVLLIACAHAASLLLARSFARAREMTVRTALGASRGRVVRQLLVESVLLSIVAGAFGLALASVGVRLFANETSDFGMPYWTTFAFDAQLFTFTAVVSLAVGVVFGLVPALYVSKPNLNEVLNQAGRSTTPAARTRLTTAVLLMAELAVTVVLLSGAGLLLQSAQVLYRADQRIDVSNLWEFRVLLPQPQYADAERRRAFYRRLDERLLAAPGFSSATLASVAPFLGTESRPALMDGEQLETGAAVRTTRVVLVGDRYFATLGVPLVRGRGFDELADSSIETVALVNERFAEMFSSNQDPIGRRVTLVNERATPAVAEPFTISGIAPPIRQGPASGQQPIVYLSYGGREQAAASVIIRGNADAFAQVLRQEVRSIDPDLPLYGLESLARLSEKSRWVQRASSTFFSVFAVIAVALSALGLYAVTAYNATQRRQEIGIRMALGARSSQVTWLFLRTVLVQLSIALTLGLIGALGAGAAIRSLLIQTRASDPPTLAGVSVLLMVVAITATVLPTRRATRADPLVTLRHD